MDTLKSMTDEELVASYFNGNNSAFDILLNRHRQNLYNYIFFTIKNKELAEDIFQETFIKAIITIKQGRYVETGRFYGWVSRIAHNLIIDHFRQAKYENTVSNDDTPVDLLNNPNLSDATIEDQMVKMQINEDVRKLISCLPSSQKEVLEMRYYKDLSFKEIADLTGVSINTALGRMRYAIINIRRIAEENSIVLTL